MPPERLVLLLTLLCCPPVLAGAPVPDDAGNKARVREPEVSIELLEFLGSWGNRHGPVERNHPGRRRGTTRAPSQGERT